MESGKKILGLALLTLLFSLCLIFGIDYAMGDDDIQKEKQITSQIGNISVVTAGVQNGAFGGIVKVYEFDYKGYHYTCILIGDFDSKKGGVDCFREPKDKR